MPVPYTMLLNFNPVECRGNYSATSKYTGCSWVGCYIWYSEEGTGQGRSLPMRLVTVPNVTAYPSTASVPISVLLVRCFALKQHHLTLPEAADLAQNRPLWTIMSTYGATQS